MLTCVSSFAIDVVDRPGTTMAAETATHNQDYRMNDAFVSLVPSIAELVDVVVQASQQEQVAVSQTQVIAYKVLRP